MQQRPIMDFGKYRKILYNILLLPYDTPPLFNRRVCQRDLWDCLAHPEHEKIFYHMYFNNLSYLYQDIMLLYIFRSTHLGESWLAGIEIFGTRLWSSPIRLELGLPPYPNTFIWSLSWEKRFWARLSADSSFFYQKKLAGSLWRLLE